MVDRYTNLYPPFKELLLKFEESFKKNAGIPIFLYCGYRSFEQQNDLYKIGRRGINGEKIITNSEAGQSYHNFGVAADYVFDSDLLKPGIQWSWDQKFPWNKIGEVAKSLSLNWGGNFKIKDYPHLEKTWDLDLLNYNIFYKLGGLEKVWEELDKRISTKVIIPVTTNIKSTEIQKIDNKLNNTTTFFQNIKNFFGIIK